jgi:hypothetical protein
MVSRSEFSQHLATLYLSHADRAVALLYYYRETQEFDERSASDLAADLHDEGFPRPNVTRLRQDLTRSRFTTRGSKTGVFQLDLRRLSEVAALYEESLARKKVHVTKHVVPTEWVAGTRTYLERMVYQINVAYDYGMYDASAVLLRRLMESLIIEIYIHEKRHHEIQSGGVFFMLDRLISHITSDTQVSLSRNAPKTMREVKQLGDTAAHDRTYITPQIDIEDMKSRYRRLLQELLVKAGITT